jgi:hypothetical protein
MAQDKVYVDSNYRRSKNQARIEKEEKELEALINKSSEEVEEEIQEEEAQEQPKEAESEDKELNAEEKTFKKRYGDLRRHMAEKEKEWEKRFAALENAKKTSEIVPPKSDEDIEAWARKYPDVASIVHTIAEKKAKELFSKTESRLREFDEVQYEAQRTKAETQIRKAHEDFDELRASDEFHNWAEEQPKWVQDALYENSDDPASVIRVIDLYKVDNGLTPSAKKAKSKDAAKSIRTSSTPKVNTNNNGKIFKESQIAKMSDKEFEANWDAIQAAQASGNFVYDMSGGAR